MTEDLLLLLLLLMLDKTMLWPHLNNLLLLLSLNCIVGRCSLDGLRHYVGSWTDHSPVLWGHWRLWSLSPVRSWRHGLRSHRLRCHGLWRHSLGRLWRLVTLTLLGLLLLYGSSYRTIGLTEVDVLLALTEILRIVRIIACRRCSIPGGLG